MGIGILVQLIRANERLTFAVVRSNLERLLICVLKILYCLDIPRTCLLFLVATSLCAYLFISGFLG